MKLRYTDLAAWLGFFGVMFILYLLCGAFKTDRISKLESCLGPTEQMPPEPSDGSPDPCFQVRELKRQMGGACDMAGSSLVLADRVDGAMKRVTIYCTEIEARRQRSTGKPEKRWVDVLFRMLTGTPQGVDNSEGAGLAPEPRARLPTDGHQEQAAGAKGVPSAVRGPSSGSELPEGSGYPREVPNGP